MLPIHSKKSRGRKALDTMLRSVRSLSTSSLILLLLMTSVNLFLLIYSTGFSIPSLAPSGSQERDNSKRHSVGSHHGKKPTKSYFSKKDLSTRDIELEPHDELINSKLVVATFASDAYLYHVKTLVGSVQYWQEDFQVNIYYKSSNNLQSKLNSFKSVRAIPLREAIDDILELRDKQGKCTHLLNSLGNALDGMERLVDQDTVYQPIVILHAFCTSEKSLGALYIEPWMFLNGWIDIAVRSLQYDNFLIPCTDKSDKRNTCLKGIQGYGSIEMIEELLLPQLGCTVQGKCKFLERASSSGVTDFDDGVRSWWIEKAPEYIESSNNKCLNSSNFMIASYQKTGHDQFIGNEDDSASCLVGGNAQPYQCYLRYNAIEDYDRFSSSGRHSKRGHKSTPSVVLGYVIHTPTSGLISHIEDMPLLDSTLTTLADEFQSNSAYDIHIYLAFESSGDEDVDSKAAKQISYQMQVSLNLKDVQVVSVGSVDSISTVSNLLFQLAMDDGHNYFMALSDGTKLVKASSEVEGSWLAYLLEAFSVSELPDFGVAAPLDHSNAKGIPSPLVHRTHYEIFGKLYPDHLTFYESQVWISTVYGYQYTFLMVEVEVNTDKHKAAICLNDHLLQESVQSGKRDIAAWAQKIGGKTLDYVLSVQEM